MTFRCLDPISPDEKVVVHTCHSSDLLCGGSFSEDMGSFFSQLNVRTTTAQTKGHSCVSLRDSDGGGKRLRVGSDADCAM